MTGFFRVCPKTKQETAEVYNRLKSFYDDLVSKQKNRRKKRHKVTTKTDNDEDEDDDGNGDVQSSSPSSAASSTSSSGSLNSIHDSGIQTNTTQMEEVCSLICDIQTLVNNLEYSVVSDLLPVQPVFDDRVFSPFSAPIVTSSAASVPTTRPLSKSVKRPRMSCTATPDNWSS